MKKYIFFFCYWYLTFEVCPFFERMYYEHGESPFFFYISFLFFYCYGNIVSKFLEKFFNFKRSTVEVDLFFDFIKLLAVNFKNFSLVIFVKTKKLIFSFMTKFSVLTKTIYTFVSSYSSFFSFK